MKSKDAEKMRLELESFLNSCLKQKERAWPMKHITLSNQEQKDPSGASVVVEQTRSK